MKEFKLPDNLVPLSSKQFDDFGISRATLKNWILNYTTKDGYKLGAKLGGRWYINVETLFLYIEENLGE